MNQIGANIKKRRKALGLTQKQLAEMLGYKSSSTINKIEMGINDIPRSTFEKLSQALDINPVTLLGLPESDVYEREIFDITNRIKVDETFRTAIFNLFTLDQDEMQLVLQLLNKIKH